MAAAAFSQLFRHESLEVCLIESEEVGTVGVGESSIPPMKDFNRLLGINEVDFILATNATPKLAIKFSNWGKLGDNYCHPFGQVGHDINGLDFHHFWLSLRNADLPEYSRYSIAAEAAEQGRFALPSEHQGLWATTFNYAYHFDAVRYAAYLNRYAQSRGVKRIEGKFVSATQDEQGNICDLMLESGEKITGDFFIDATGFRALLIEKLLKTPYESWQHWLKCDSAIAIPCSVIKPLKAFTHSTAHKAGWQWRIPLQHRVGNGMVFSSQYVSREEALSDLLSNIEAEPLAEPRHFSFIPGMRENQWSHNCVALGLAGGFLEPLESTSIYLIQFAIQKLIEYFPVSTDFSFSKKEFNKQLQDEYRRIRDFIIMHYAENQRQDSVFWQDCRAMPLPESLGYRQMLFRQAGVVDPTQYGVYAAVCLGQNVIPDNIDQRVNQIDWAERIHLMKKIKQDQENYIAQFPLLSDWLRTAGVMHDA
jgi:tryptophan halogenase